MLACGRLTLDTARVDTQEVRYARSGEIAYQVVGDRGGGAASSRTSTLRARSAVRAPFATPSPTSGSTRVPA
jgi:hypothetical protein